MIINIEEVEAFLREHNRPLIVTASTIKNGYVSCIRPVPTICGPELHVNESTRQELEQIANNPKGSD